VVATLLPNGSMNRGIRWWNPPAVSPPQPNCSAVTPATGRQQARYASMSAEYMCCWVMESPQMATRSPACKPGVWASADATTHEATTAAARETIGFMGELGS
jgi:hypothetical protein